ncbi:MAG TPA: tRNA-uridine aminocarboxypropyltransferase [Candidatus Limnocylindria bacterium]|nr:tRNA-uridine aminocarboxypropyltransferase [Candidatus Limnocylindria bacterium]
MASIGKAKQRCPKCDSSLTLCMCAVLPRLDLRTKVTLVIHRHELLRSSNTGMLARRALVNSELRIRGESREMLDLSDLLSSHYRSLLFYPSADAVELTPALVDQDPRPIQLIVPDGTWRQSRKIHSRHHELKSVPRVKISTPNDSTFQLRAQSRREGMATLLAIAAALAIIEGETVAGQLIMLYQARVTRTLRARGLLPQISESSAASSVRSKVS